MKKGDWVQTRRFCGVRITKVFRTMENALKAGFNEPSYYCGPDRDRFDILGKPLGDNRMIFAAYRK